MKISKKITMKPVADLTMINDSHDIRNAVPAVQQSVKDFGIQSPIVIDKEGKIVAGNAVYQAAVNLGIEKVPCVLFEGTPEEMRKYRLADNKTAEFASWDTPKLKQEMSYLTSELKDMQFAFEEDLFKMIGVADTSKVSYPTLPGNAPAAPGVSQVTLNRAPIPSNNEIPQSDAPIAQATVVQGTPVSASTPQPSQPVVDPVKEKQKDDKFREQLRQIEHQQMAKQREYIEYICSNCGRKVILSNR